MAVHTLKDAKQLKKLVLEPLNLLAPCGITPYVIILDGLDETLSPDDQQLVLNIISETLYPLNPRLRILICCRPEPIIVTALNDPDSQLNSISTSISLNDDVDSDADIRAFLVDKFARIKKQLPYPPSEDWPTPANIDYLVAKSSGQFIFAATVEKYVCSPKHRHQAIARLKHVLDLGLLPHLEDKKKHPFADLDALYALILKTRNDIDMSVKATAVCLEYPKYFNSVSPADLAKVLHIELIETWAILYELASLFDASEDSIRPFHASFGDFLFDSERSLDFFCIGEDIVADITCAMLRPHRDPEALSYRTFSRLLGGATRRQDLRDILNQMSPLSIFMRPAASRKYSGRSKGAYYLIPLLRQLENHVSSDVYKNIVAYFDRHFALFLPSGYWRSEIFQEYRTRNKGNKGRAYAETDSDMPEIQSLSGTDDSDDDDDDDEQIHRGLKARRPKPASYQVSKLAPLSTSPAWDEINPLNIHLTGSDSLRGLCDEAHFVRAHLSKTSLVLLDGSTQAEAALFCLKQMKDEGVTEELHVTFAKLLPHSLSHAEQLPKLTTEIQNWLTHPTLCKGLPLVTMNAITDYDRRLRSQNGFQKPWIPAGAVPKVSPAPQRPPGIPKASTKATTSQKPSTTPTSSTPHRTAQKSSRTPQPPSTSEPKYQALSQSQPVPRIFLSPRTQPSPGTSQKASTASQAHQKASKFSTPSQPQPAQPTPQSSAQTQPSPSTAQKPLTMSRTPEQPKASRLATIPGRNASTNECPSSTTLGVSLESLTSAQAPSDSSQHYRSPSRHRKSRKGRPK